MPALKPRGTLLNAPDYADRVNLIKKIKVDGSWRFAPVVPEPEAAPKTKIGDAIDAHLRYVRMQRRPRTYLTYRYTLDVLLRASYKRQYVEDATRDDVLNFMTYYYELGLGARTVYDKVVTVLQLFKKHGRSGLMEKGDWPK